MFILITLIHYFNNFKIHQISKNYNLINYLYFLHFFIHSFKNYLKII